MIKEVTDINDADRCDELLTKLIQDERKYDNTIEEDFIVNDYFRNMLKDSGIKLLGYYDNDTIVGYILVRKTSDNICLLDGLYVEENYRNKKISNKLISKALEICKEFGAKHVDISVMADNEIAIELYKKFNFGDFKIQLRKDI